MMDKLHCKGCEYIIFHAEEGLDPTEHVESWHCGLLDDRQIPGAEYLEWSLDAEKVERPSWCPLLKHKEWEDASH